MENKTNINWYPGHMAKTKRLIKENMSFIDVVLELVDARIPFSSKINDMDDLLKNKKRIIVMTKYDLCDKKETDKWIKHYEKMGYVVLAVNLKNNYDYKKVIETIRDLVKGINDKRRVNNLLDKEIKVLVMGIPNVGKSTLINTLAGKKSQKVENKPGVTKDLVWIKTNHNIRILDTPGILWPKLDEISAKNLASITSIKEGLIPIDEISYYILTMLNKYYKNILLNKYNIDSEDVYEMYEIIASKIGAVKNNEIDYERVSNILINDIKNEKIVGITFDRYE